jgi:hypothetical protein
MEQVKTVWKKTEGYKTASAGVLVLLFQLFQLIWPDALQEQWEDWIYNAIGVIGATGIIDKIWRSRHKIKEVFTRKKEKL